MYEREPLERFLYRINRNQTWAGLFSIAMTVVGLLAIMGLVVLTVWGVASFNSANTKLAAANVELANTQARVVELTAIANSNSNSAELLKVQTDLATAKQQISDKDQQIADLQKQLTNNTNTAPTSPAGPVDCENCDSKMKEVVISLRSQNGQLKKQLDECNAKTKSTGKGVDKSTIIND